MQKVKKTFTISVKGDTISLLKEIKLRLLKEKQETYSNNEVIEMLLSMYKENEEYRKRVDECVKVDNSGTRDTHGLIVSPEVKYELMKMVIEKKTTVIRLVDCLVKNYG